MQSIMSKASPNTQSGMLLSGSSAIRANQLLASLVPLTREEQELVNKAKKYAMEQSIKNILTKQTNTSQQQQQETLRRHQALVLMCRVYVGSISFELREETIKVAFAPFGAIKSVNMSWDPVTLKHKGFAFVEYELPEAAQLALEHMNGIQLGGRQIKAGRPSNMPQAAPVIQQIQEECKEKNRIYVSNIPLDLCEPELITIFEPFGKVRTCKLAVTPNVENPTHRGYGFIEFDSEAAATEALTMNNLDLGGQVLHVCHATTPADHMSIYGTLESDSQSATNLSNSLQEEDIQLQLERANREQERNVDLSNSNIPAETHLNLPPSTSLDICTSSSTTNEINQKKSRDSHELSDHASSINGLSQEVSNIIVLRNMVGADEELDDGLQLDVYGECGKYGAISQIVIHVDKKPIPLPDEPSINNHHTQHSPSKDIKSTEPVDEVKIFVKYKEANSSKRAKEVLDGRFFAGRKVSAEHYDWNRFRLSDYSH